MYIAQDYPRLFIVKYDGSLPLQYWKATGYTFLPFRSFQLTFWPSLGRLAMSLRQTPSLMRICFLSTVRFWEISMGIICIWGMHLRLLKFPALQKTIKLYLVAFLSSEFLHLGQPQASVHSQNWQMPQEKNSWQSSVHLRIVPSLCP